MSFSAQTDNLRMFSEAVSSKCEKVRFGSEFCEWKIPSLPEVEKAHALAKDRGKVFTYITPRVSDEGLKKIRAQLDFLNGAGKIAIVVNDLGTLNIMGDYPELSPYLGRQLVHMPARCPWLKMRFGDLTSFRLKALKAMIEKRHVEDIYSQTSLNYSPTIRLFQSYGIQGVDLDWIPRCFPYSNFLVKAGLNLFVHLHLIPVALTRKCHTARFLGEKTPENCSKPCDSRAFLLKHRGLTDEAERKLFLQGNVVFRLVQPSRTDTEKLLRSGVTNFVITMNPVTKISSREEIDKLIVHLKQETDQ